MDTRQLEKFAQDARRQLHEQVGARLERVLRTDSAELRAKAKTIQALKEQIARSARKAVVEQVAYTWFNRFIALRYMDVNRYTRMGTVSPADATYTQPEILQEAKQGYIDPQFAPFVDAQTVTGLLNGRLPSPDPQQEAYRLLLVAVCNAYHDTMPFMFEPIDDYTELLMPDDLLSEHSILQAVREALTAENCQDVEVIGWLYQYYISEKKDTVMARKTAVPTADIPAVTQLFTPHWIVRYMVENSLGRLWMLNHPESRLVDRMDYYIAPDEAEVASSQLPVTGNRTNNQQLATSNYLRISSPEEITLCDPACGSGHILTYAFDLLYAIYEESGYDPVQIPRLILEKNLTGIEIDPRAGALAGFALMMKAREKDQRFFRRGVTPNIMVMENVTFTPQELKAFAEVVGRDLFTLQFQELLQQFEQATTFGSLIRPAVKDTAYLRQRVNEPRVRQNLFLSNTHERMQQVLDMADVLNTRYHVVVANPPYMGGKGMNTDLKVFAKNQYPDSKSDLFAMFIERGLELVTSKGYNAMVTMQSWMFLSSYEKLRKDLLDTVTIICMVHMANMVMGIAFGTAATIWHKNLEPDVKGYYSYVNYQDLTDENVPFEFPVQNERLATASATDFKKIPGAPIAYWVSDRVRKVFEEGVLLDTLAESRNGMTTGKNDRFLRHWYEVSLGKIGFDYRSEEEASISGLKWFPYNKGGQYRKWYGNQDFVVNWEHNGNELRKFRGSVIRNPSYYFRESITWTLLSSSYFGVRYLPSGFLFDVNGMSCFPQKDIYKALGFLSSVVCSELLKIINPTMAFQVGDIKRLPILSLETDISENAKRLIDMTRSDWDANETSWNFDRFPLLTIRNKSLEQVPDQSSIYFKINITYLALRVYWQSLVTSVTHLEEENNQLIIETYNLQQIIDSKMPPSEITLTCNSQYRYGSASLEDKKWDNFCQLFPETQQHLLAIAEEMAPAMPEKERLGLEQRLLDDTMREFISYAVGCMFGRYSLDAPGLILANQGESLEDYVRKVVQSQKSKAESQDNNTDNSSITYRPDADNVIPMLDGDWFADDISERFKQFLRVTFGDEHYDENLRFIELAIGRDIRSYFLRDFYTDHITTYKKRPIYWLFSSPKGSFNALIYMHRYQPDTASIILNDYLREFRTKLTARKSHLEQVSISGSASQRDKTQALKEIDQIDKTLNELREYEDKVLYPLAAQKVEIDLDDGVLVNYNKFGKALKRVGGLSQ